MKRTSRVDIRRVSGIAVFVCAFLACSLSFGAEGWRSADATIRFRLSLKDSPSHKSAGYFVRLQDGGILPGPCPVTSVFDEGGKELKSYALWYSVESGLYMIFESPGFGSEVDVYVKGGQNLNIWRPNSGLTPSAMFCTDSGHDSAGYAEAMQKMGVVNGEFFSCVNRPGARAANLCISGDLRRETGPSCFYMLSYVDLEKGGSTWIAPYTYGNAAVKISIDSQAVNPQKKNDKPGGVGQAMNLSQGLHRVDILVYGHGNGEWPAKGLVALTWQPPGSKMEELGGERPKDLKYPGTSRWESRHLNKKEVVTSGSCRIESIVSKDGGPVPFPGLEDQEIYWFGDEVPVILYKLNAVTNGNPSDTAYFWNIDDPAAKLNGKNRKWLFEGRKWHNIKLTAATASKTMTCSVRLYPYTTKDTTLENPYSRAAFREGAVNMFEAYPKDVDPTASWGESMWHNFVRNMEFGQEAEMLKSIFSRWDNLKAKLSAEEKERMEDVFISAVTRLDPKGMLDWISRFQKDIAGPKGGKGPPTSERFGELELIRAEISMYYLKDLESARKMVVPLMKSGKETAEWAKIRMGDIALLSTNLNDATKYYSEVQDKVKFEMNKAQAEKEIAEKDPKDKKHKTDGQVPRKAAGALVDVKVDEWKVAVIQEAARSETVMKLIDERFYDEAWGELKRWERNFPMSKINGDFIVREAKFYMALGDYVRPRLTLASYCEQTEASNYLSLSLRELLTCMEGMKESLESQKKFCKDVQKRLKFDPICDDIEIMMQSLEGKPAEIDRTIMDQIEGGVRIVPRKK